jgi:sulfide:quinone oxidoreductase
MQLRPLTKDLSVAAQIAVADIAALAAQGFRSVINNRPDGEESGQPSSSTLTAAARQAGLDYRHIPVVPGQLQDSQVTAFSAALAEMPAPVLAFCRTGTRSSTLWALQASGSADTILETAKAAGYDLSGLRPRLGDAAHGH